MITQPKQEEVLDRIPTRSSMRALLSKVALNDSDLRMLCLDHLPDIMRHFSAGMSYEAMLNTLLERVTTNTLLSAIESCQGMAARLGLYRDLVRWESSVHAVQNAMPKARLCRAAVPPARSAYSSQWYISRPEEEAQALDALEYSGAAVVLNAPSALGKTWMLQHLVEQLRSRGRIIQLDLRAFGSDAVMSSYSGFLRELGREILIEALLSDPKQATAMVDEAWRRADNSIHSINTLMKRDILPSFTGGRWLILSFDGADALSAYSYAEDFFTLLRSWMDNAGRQPWSALRVLITVATAPRLLINCVHQSPFNIATQIYLSDFNDQQVKRLAAQYDLSWQLGERQALMEIVGGHPYLLRLAMHEAWRTGKLVLELIAPRSQVFTDYLYHQERWLHASPSLCETFTRAVTNANTPIDFDSFDRLRHAGFLVKGDNGEVKTRYRLYERLIGLSTR